MLRRLYFLFPDVKHAEQAVADLEQHDIDWEHMHCVARSDIDLSTLPLANKRQKSDRVWILEQWFWYGNLFVFGLALIGLVTALYWSSTGWALGMFGLMIISFIAGERFAVKLPHAHLNEMNSALNHGEILLMLDLPKERIIEIEHLVHCRHPEAEVGGVGWTSDALGT